MFSPVTFGDSLGGWPNAYLSLEISCVSLRRNVPYVIEYRGARGGIQTDMRTVVRLRYTALEMTGRPPVAATAAARRTLTPPLPPSLSPAALQEHRNYAYVCSVSIESKGGPNL